MYLGYLGVEICMLGSRMYVSIYCVYIWPVHPQLFNKPLQCPVRQKKNKTTGYIHK